MNSADSPRHSKNHNYHKKRKQAGEALCQAQLNWNLALTKDKLVTRFKIIQNLSAENIPFVYCFDICKKFLKCIIDEKLSQMKINKLGGLGQIEIKDHLSPAEADIGAELGN